MGEIKTLTGSKSLGGGSSPVSSPNTLFSEDTAELLLALSEGPIKGLPNGPRDVFVGGTPLTNIDGKPNIGNFDLRFHPGVNPADPVQFNLGGSGSSTTVSVKLEKDTPVIRTGSYQNIDYIELRLVVNQLMSINPKKGDYPAWMEIKIEIKPSASATWDYAYSGTIPPQESILGSITRYLNLEGSATNTNPFYREMYIQDAAPGEPENINALWFDLNDGYKPYSWNGTTWAAITATNNTPANQYPFWSWLEGAITRKAYYGDLGGVVPPTPGTNDFWVAPAGTRNNDNTVAYVWNGTSWVDYMDWNIPVTTAPGVIRIDGKTSSAYVKEIRFPVNRTTDTYDIRVTNLSPETNQYYLADCTWESFQELTADTPTYDDLALAHLTMKVSDQFSSVPEILFTPEGRIIQVPSNYNVETNSYAGIWDGTFKLEYCNNPAWVAYDLVNNDRYGLAAYYPIVLDKWSVYAFSEHCIERGFTYNHWIREAMPLMEAINYVCGIAGGRLIERGDGYATIVFDADDQPAVDIFGPENVVDGVFTYSYTDLASRKNDITVSFKNQDYGWIEDRRRVFDTTDIELRGRNPEEFIAVGCNNEEEAIKRARLRLLIALTERTIVSFRTNRQGRYLAPYEIILIADEDSGFGISGRVQEVIDSTHITLRDNVYFESGLTYKIKFSYPNNGVMEIVEHTLTTSSGSTTNLVLATPLAVTLPEYCVFTIECVDTVGEPKAFLITSIEEVEGDPDNIQITAREVNRNKWAIVDGAVTSENISYTGQITRSVEPITGLAVLGERAETDTYNITLSWDRSPTPLVTKYNVYRQVNGGQVLLHGETRNNNFLIEDLLQGSYVFSVRAVNLDGLESRPVSIPYDITGDARQVSAPSNLVVVDGAAPGVFRTRSPTFEWDASDDPFLARYRVRVKNISTSEVKRDFYTTLQTWTYDFDANESDFGSASREFTVEVSAVDDVGNQSDYLSLSVTNPQPSLGAITTSGINNVLDISYQRPVDKDFAGVKVWVSETSGFTPGPSNLVYDGPDTSIQMMSNGGTTLYVRVAAYDNFDQEGLVPSSQTEVLITAIAVDTSPPTVPGGLSLSTSIITLPTGELDTLFTATWTAVTDESLSHYDVWIRPSAGIWTSLPTTTNRAEWRGLPFAATYEVKVRSVSKLGYPSAFGTPASLAVASKATGPAAPTALATSAAIRNIVVTWTNAADTDIAYTEVWAHTADSRASATKVGAISGTTFVHSALPAGATRYYWVRHVNTSGVVGAWNATGGVVGTLTIISTTDIADTIITTTKLASNIAAPTLVASLPGSGDYVGQLVVLTTDQKLYRWTGAGWTTTVPAADVTGQLTNSQIADLEAAKLTGTISSSQIANSAVTLSKFAAGTTPVEIVATLPASGNFQGRTVVLTSDNKVYRYTGSAWTAAVPAGDVSGQLSDSQIADLAAGKLTGQISNAQITDGAISVAKFAAGLTPVEIVATLPTSGNFQGRTALLTSDNKLYRYTGSSWTSAVPASDVSGLLTSTQIASITAAQLTGQITATQITDGAITTGKVAAGAISTAKLAAGAVTADKVAANTLTANEIDAGAITAAELAAGAVVTGKIAAGAVTADEIAAGAITSDKFVSGSSTLNAVINGNFEENLVGWTASSGAVTIDLTQSAVGTRSVKIDRNSQYQGFVRSGKVPLTGGDTFVLNFKAKATDGPQTNGYRILLYYYSISNSLITSGSYFFTSETDWTAYEQLFVAPSDTRYAYIYMYDWGGTGTADEQTWFDNVSVKPIVTTAQIDNEAITLDKLTAGIPFQFANLLPNGSFEEGIDATGPNNTGYFKQLFGTTTINTDNTVSAYGTVSVKIDRGTVSPSNSGVLTIPRASIIGGLTYEVSALAKASQQISALYGGRIVVQWNTAANTFIGVVNLNVPAGTDWAKFSALITAPSNAAYAIPILYHSASSEAQVIWYDDLSIRRSIGSTIIEGGAITTDKISAGAVTAGVIQAGTITSAELASGSITAAKIASGVITATHIATGTITATQLATNSVTTAQISAGAVTTAEIAAGTIVAGNIAANAITATQLATDSVTTVKLSASAVTTAKIAALAITVDKVAANAITAAKIVAGTITAAELATDSVTTAKIAAGAVGADEIAANVITAAKIVAGTITGDKIAAATIAAGNIAADAITTPKIAAGAVTAAELAATSVTADKIATNAVTTDKLAANAVTATKIAAGTITATHIETGTITATQIAGGTITATQLAASAVTTEKIATNAVTAAQINVTSLSAISANVGTVTAGIIRDVNSKFIIDLANAKLEVYD